MEKDRIFELVRQGIITTEEALELLEASGTKETAEEFQAELDNEEKEYFSKEYQNAMNDEATIAEDKAEYADLSEKVKALTKELAEHEKALTIINQRYRELEIFQEIDELTADMEQQFHELVDQKVQLEEKVAQVKADLEEAQSGMKQMNAEKINHYSEEFKQFVNEQASSAKRVGQTVAKETKTLGESLKSVVKDLSNSFQMKDISMGVKIPWLKSSVTEKAYEFAGDALNSLSVNILNGSLSVQTHDKPTIYMALTIREFGNDGDISIETFEELNVVTQHDDSFTLDLKSPKYATNVDMYVPATMIEYINLSLINGDLTVNGLNGETFNVKNKNGGTLLTNIKAPTLMIDTLNSDIKIEDSEIAEAAIQNVNGDIRYEGVVNLVTINSANSNVFITKTNAEATEINVKILSGDVKVAIPETLGIKAEVKSKMGTMYTRLTDAAITNADTTHSIDRELEKMVNMKVSVTTGNVFVKDTE